MGGLVSKKLTWKHFFSICSCVKTRGTKTTERHRHAQDFLFDKPSGVVHTCHEHTDFEVSTLMNCEMYFC